MIYYDNDNVGYDDDKQTAGTPVSRWLVTNHWSQIWQEWKYKYEDDCDACDAGDDHMIWYFDYDDHDDHNDHGDSSLTIVDGDDWWR